MRFGPWSWPRRGRCRSTSTRRRVDRHTLTRELIEASGVFALNLLCRVQAETVLAVGSCSGRDPECGGDKFTRFGLVTLPAARIEAPLLAGCVECRVIPEARNEERYDLFLGEVVAAWADPAVFADGRWHFEAASAERRTLYYVAGGAFYATGEGFEVASAPSGAGA